MVWLYYLQGRVKFPTGGKVRERKMRRIGVIPIPTVKSGWKKVGTYYTFSRPDCKIRAFFVWR